MSRHPRRLQALWIKGLALTGIVFLAAAPIQAQDGQQETGPPVNRPKTDELIPRPDTSTPPIQDADQLLPPVPASIEDPAPPGTNAEPVVPESGRRARNQATREGRARPGIRATEGVVVEIEPVKNSEPTRRGLQNALIRLSIDPSQTWADFAESGPLTPAEDDAAPNEEGEAANPTREAKAVEEPSTTASRETPLLDDVETLVRDVKQVVRTAKNVATPRRRDAGASDAGAAETVEVVVTNRTRVFVHARTSEGVDLYGAETISSPDTTPSGVGVTGRVPKIDRPEPFATNFTNIKVGSYVMVRYRSIGRRNEAVNINLIELPLNPPAERSGAPATGAAPAPAEITPGEVTPGEVTPGDRIPVRPRETIREPVVPAQPTAPAIPR